MKGWNGRLLRVGLTNGKTAVQEYSEDLAKSFVGGRGFAIKLLWDELRPGLDLLSSENMLIFTSRTPDGVHPPQQR